MGLLPLHVKLSRIHCCRPEFLTTASITGWCTRNRKYFAIAHFSPGSVRPISRVQHNDWDKTVPVNGKKHVPRHVEQIPFQPGATHWRRDTPRVDNLPARCFQDHQLAMLLPKLSLADLARSGHVTRWHSVRTSRDQTLAEHHYMVIRISNKLAKEILGPDLTDSFLLQIMEYASLHDTPELLMGDLPSPLKHHIERISGGNNPIDAIEHAIAPWLTRMKQEMRPEHLLLVKLADIIDALVFITLEGVGEHAQQVIRILHKMLEEKLNLGIKRYPQYPWKYTLTLLNELLQNKDGSKIAFESMEVKP